MAILNIEKSMTYETILALVRSDYQKALDIYLEIEKRVDINLQFPFYAKDIVDLLPCRKEDAEEVWRRVRDVYDSKRLEYEIIDHKSPLFPQELMETEFPTPLFYALGNLALLEKPVVTVLGALSPTEKAKEVTKAFISHLTDGKHALLIPLEIGVPSFAAAELLNNGGNIIAVSAQFLSVPPVEALKVQMIEILKHGGLIVTSFGPCSKSEKWHNIIRNRAISAFAGAAFMVEEKDGGPSWKIFDMVESERKMISSHMLDNPMYSFARKRVEEGVQIAKGEKEYKSLLRKKRQSRAKKTTDELTLDLFELTN